jgi:hypothetical protein
MDEQMTVCKVAVLFFDRIEEKRPLNSNEFNIRLKLKENIFELACAKEMRWMQRARCKWLSVGDQNTRFFHAFASARLRINTVHVIQNNNNTYTSQSDIQGIFFHSLKDQLGTEKEVIYFHPQTLYPTSHYLQPLANPFSDDEIEKAVKELANNKASGPDGIPNERSTGQILRVLFSVFSSNFLITNLISQTITEPISSWCQRKRGPPETLGLPAN